MLSPREKQIVDAAIQWHEDNPFGVLPPEEMYDEVEYIISNVDDGGVDLPAAS